LLNKLLKLAAHLGVAFLLTVVTQIGGLIYLLVLVLIKRTVSRHHLKRTACFTVLYLFATCVLVPPLAAIYGREPVLANGAIQAHSFFYKLTNRNYVTPRLNRVLEAAALDFQRKYPGVKLVHLDANFPFIDGFPLLPHLSHNDGKKIDITLLYKDQVNTVTNRKPSVSGYGVYEGPENNEFDQISICKGSGYWQYDFPKYVTLGTINKDLTFSEEGTRAMTLSVLRQKSLKKLFIEPHLKTRLGLSNNKVRYHGCQAVRHDDHIHIQVE